MNVGRESGGAEVGGLQAHLAGETRVVGGRYRLERLLGEGAFGRVYRARDELLERTVALKLINPSVVETLSEQGAETFLAEARTIAKLDHPHIVPVFDAGLEGSSPWMAMRLVDGQSLESLLESERQLGPNRTLPLIRQAASALAHAHRRGVVHRDVKPANMLVELAEGGSEHLWLGDFGISKLLTFGTTRTESGRIVGTPQYMSPEQVAGKKVDGRADLFSLGCVAFEMLCGKPPFVGDTVVAILYAIIHRNPDLAEVERVAGGGVAQVLQKCFAKAPEDRWSSAEALLKALELEPASSLGVSRSTRRVGRERSAPTQAWDGVHAVRTVGLVKSYGWKAPVLRGVDLEVPRGSIFALLGRNGCGKTTLLRTLLGLYRRNGGQALVLGRDPEREGPHLNGRIGYVPEGPSFDDGIVVSELLGLAAALWPKWDRAYSNRLVERYGLDPGKRVKELSRGEKSKLSFVVAVGHRPEVLFLDDPTLGLDAVVLDEVLQTLEELAKEEAATILIASHNYSDLERISSHIGILDQGRVAFSGELAQLKQTAREIHLVFADDPPKLDRIPGFRLLRQSGRRVTGVLLDAAGESELRRLGAEQMTTSDLSLRELVVALLR